MPTYPGQYRKQFRVDVPFVTGEPTKLDDDMPKQSLEDFEDLAKTVTYNGDLSRFDGQWSLLLQWVDLKGNGHRVILPHGVIDRIIRNSKAIIDMANRDRASSRRGDPPPEPGGSQWSLNPSSSAPAAAANGCTGSRPATTTSASASPATSGTSSNTGGSHENRIRTLHPRGRADLPGRTTLDLQVRHHLPPKVYAYIHRLMLETRHMKNYPVDLERRWLGDGSDHQLSFFPGPEQTRRRM